MRGRDIWCKTIMAAVAAGALGGPAWAQNRDKAWEVTPRVGWVFFGDPNLGDGTTVRTTVTPPQRDVRVVTSEIDDSATYGFNFGYHWTKRQMVDFGFSGSATTGTFFLHKQVFDTSPEMAVPPGPAVLISDVNKAENVSIDHIVVHINYVYNFFLHHRDKVVAFVTGGIGVVNTSIFGQTADSDLLPVLSTLVGDENAFMFNYGGGIRFFGSEKAGVRIDLRQVRYDSDVRGRQDQLQATVALTFVLGGA